MATFPESAGEREELAASSRMTEGKPSSFSAVLGEDDARMLEGIRERLLVLFEGFQSQNNVQIEAKIDMTLNFLEYLLATIDNRLETMKPL